MRARGGRIELKRKGLAGATREEGEGGDMRGLASTRGFPNCAVSLSVIDRFASAINTGHQALTTPYSPSPLSPLRRPIESTLVRPPTYIFPTTFLPSSLSRSNHPPTVYHSPLRLSLSLSSFPSPSLPHPFALPLD